MNVRRCFDHFDRDQLARLAKGERYPAIALHLSVYMNTKVRRALWDGSLSSDEVSPTTGIAPGYTFATMDLYADLMDVYVRSTTKLPTIAVSVYVDDMIFESEAQSQRQVSSTSCKPRLASPSTFSST